MSDENELRVELEGQIKQVCLDFEKELINSERFDEITIRVIRNAYALGIKKGLEISTALKEGGIDISIKKELSGANKE